jgi:hypothetical protein
VCHCSVKCRVSATDSFFLFLFSQATCWISFLNAHATGLRRPLSWRLSSNHTVSIRLSMSCSSQGMYSIRWDGPRLACGSHVSCDAWVMCCCVLCAHGCDAWLTCCCALCAHAVLCVSGVAVATLPGRSDGDNAESPAGDSAGVHTKDLVRHEPAIAGRACGLLTNLCCIL